MRLAGLRLTVLMFIVATVFYSCKKNDAAEKHKKTNEALKAKQPKLEDEPLDEAAVPQKKDPIYGTDIGLDHLGIVVKDLAATKKTYTEIFGFKNATEGKLPNGLNNLVFYFEDGTYIEFIHPYDAKKAAFYANFVKKFEGGVFYVLAISSAKDTDAFMRKRGFNLSKPRSGTILLKGEKKEPKELWRTYFLEKSPFPGDPFFYIEYKPEIRKEFMNKLKNRGVRRKYFRHRNTALSLKAVWMAVPDLDAAIKIYQKMGSPVGKKFDDPRLDAKGCIIEAGEGMILLYSPASKKSPVATFLDERKRPTILGISLQVGSIIAVRNLLRQSPQIQRITAMGVLGSSILIKPEQAHGVWLEFYKKPGITRPR